MLATTRKDWQAQVHSEEMPNYEVDVGARASTAEGRKQRKARAEMRALVDIAANLAGVKPEYPEYMRKRPAGHQPSHASKAKAGCAAGSAAGSSRD